jgi:hypothetical protein
VIGPGLGGRGDRIGSQRRGLAPRDDLVAVCGNEVIEHHL